MAVDYLSTLNVGSGLNVTQIVDAIIDAELVPRENQLKAKIEERNVSISSLGEIKADMKTFDSNLDLLKGNTGLDVLSSNDQAISIEPNGKIAVEQFEHKIAVTTLARGHTLSFDGFASASDTLSANSFTFDFGTWTSVAGPPVTETFSANPDSASVTIELAPPQNTLADLASAINDSAMDVKASVIRISDGNYGLSLVSPTGADNQMRLSAFANVARTDFFAPGSGAGTLGDALAAAEQGDKFKFNNGTSDIEITVPAGVTAGSFTLDDLVAELESSAPDLSYKFEVDTGELKITDETAGVNAESYNLYYGPAGTYGAALTYGVATGVNIAGNTGVVVPDLNYDPENYAADSSHQVLAGSNAEFSLNGIAITRDTNQIDDLINGISLTLNETTSTDATISASYNKDKAKQALDLFVAELNYMIDKLNQATFRGTSGQDNAGPLAGDQLIKSYLSTLKNMTTKPIPGFQEDDIFLSNFGVMTERNGTLSVNQTTFDEFFAANPDAFSALMNTRAVTDSNLVQAEITGTLWEAGSYEFNINPDTTADLDGDPMSLEGGKYKITTGDARGLALTLLGNGEDTTVRIGKSLLEILQDFSQSVLVENNQIDPKIAGYNDDITDYNDSLTKLSERMENERVRYREQFAAMESSVTSFKKTGDLLDNFMESWKASLN